MARVKDWVKSNHVEFYNQLEQTNTYFTRPANLAKWGFTTGGPMETWVKETYLPQVALYKAGYEAWLSKPTRTSVVTVTLRQEERKMKTLYRKLYVGFLKGNPLVSAEDFAAMDLPLPSDGSRHDADVAKTHPASRVDTSELRVLRINYGTEILEGTIVKRVKPEDQDEMEIWWAISDGPLRSFKDLVNKDVDTASPYVLRFEEEDRGKCFSYAMRWRNTRGVPGPWSPILSVYIP